jgi:hypothetical protein
LAGPRTQLRRVVNLHRCKKDGQNSGRLFCC